MRSLDEMREEIEWLLDRFTRNEAEYEKRGFTRRDDTDGTSREKTHPFQATSEGDERFEWHGDNHYIVAGIKRAHRATRARPHFSARRQACPKTERGAPSCHPSPPRNSWPIRTSISERRTSACRCISQGRGFA
ncbi:hypothetical protein SDC9_146363 [bioreactor metagenome]|uniref:Uncharacterized protein n=1 Tax=bioreactor metagenome TaxID=1076179 RepID=A0A645EEZ7_9ZZZZ